MAKPTDAICIIFDVGANSNEMDKVKEMTFYDEAKKCIEAIITRKIFTKPKDEMSLFLLGTETTDNHLNEGNPGNYTNISHALGLKPMNWDFLKYVQKNIDPPTGSIGDWVDAIIVAMDYLRNQDLKKCPQKIILFTTFSTEVNDANNVTDLVVNGLKETGIDLIVITKNVETEEDTATFTKTGKETPNQIRSRQLIMEIVSQGNGYLMDISEAAENMNYVDKKQRVRRPFNADLSIGSHLTLKVSAYIYVQDEKELSSWKTRFVRDITQVGTPNDGPSTSSINESAVSKIESVTSKIEYKYNDDVIDKQEAADDIVKGYMYGGEPVVFEDERFDNGGRSMKLIGFTNISAIKLTHLVGDSIRVVVPQFGATASTHRFAGLLAAMHSKSYAMIVRYVFNVVSVPKVMALFPDENAMMMYELHFNDCFVDLKFPPLTTNTNAPNDEQLEFMDKFIDSMDLTSENDGDPQLRSFDKLLDPALQFTYRAIAHRALNPNEPMLKIDDEIMTLLRPPKRPDAEQLKTLFPLKAAKLLAKDTIMQNILQAEKREPESDQPNLEQKKYNDIHEVGTIKPADDFNTLLDQGEPFNELSQQIEKVIINLVVKSMVAMDDKVLKALLAYRETSKQKGPFKYNSWIPTFKEELKQREKVQLWQSFVDEKLGLISENESEMSTITDEEVITFYKFDDFNTNQNYANNNDLLETDVGMFDDM